MFSITSSPSISSLVPHGPVGHTALSRLSRRAYLRRQTLQGTCSSAANRESIIAWTLTAQRRECLVDDTLVRGLRRTYKNHISSNAKTKLTTHTQLAEGLHRRGLDQQQQDVRQLLPGHPFRRRRSQAGVGGRVVAARCRGHVGAGVLAVKWRWPAVKWRWVKWRWRACCLIEVGKGMSVSFKPCGPMPTWNWTWSVASPDRHRSCSASRHVAPRCCPSSCLMLPLNAASAAAPAYGLLLLLDAAPDSATTHAAAPPPGD